MKLDGDEIYMIGATTCATIAALGLLALIAWLIPGCQASIFAKHSLNLCVKQTTDNLKEPKVELASVIPDPDACGVTVTVPPDWCCWEGHPDTYTVRVRTAYGFADLKAPQPACHHILPNERRELVCR